jgi:phage tail tape-measure protein
MSKKTEYEKKLQTQLDEFSTEIDKLKARAEKAEEPWYKQQVEMLQEKHKQAKEKLGALRDAGDDAWEDMKEGIANSWDAVGKAVKSAAKRFE